MGCDYYIKKLLAVNVRNLASSENPVEPEDIIYIELEKEGWYFLEVGVDEDHPDYEKRLEERDKEALTPDESILIYKDGKFRSDRLELKYRDLVSKKLHENGKSWDHVFDIYKIEERYLRG